MKKNKFSIVLNGLIAENPIFVLMLGMCPTLATTTSAINGLGMGLATTFVLIFSNLVISLIKNLVPENVRIPSYIVVIATFVTILEMLMQAYLPSLHESLGLFIPLIVVNCIVLGRAESFASKNKVFDSALDGIGIGLGFTFALGLLGMIRELLGAGTLLGFRIFPEHYGMLLFILAPGAFISLAYLIAIVNRIRKVS
ncbi:MAG: electron transport complex subunit E [Bacteroidales bacterium]|nr:electron transport complex subunit E [Bacteroidales bacterium]